MVRQYKRKTEKAAYSKEKLQNAVRLVRNGDMSGYKAAKVFNIPRMTIMDHVHNKRGKSSTLGRNRALSLEIEQKLASYIHVMERNGFGLTRDEILDIVANYVNQNEIETPFKNGRPGKDWFISFKERNFLSIKKPQAVEYARKKAIDPFIIYPYFELLKNTINDLGLSDKPSAIWNLDETSFSKDPSKAKIVGRRGHAAKRTVSGSGKDNTTVLLAANAMGDKMPPLIIYKGKNVWDQWTSPNAYPNTTYAATTNGWMEAEVFENYFKKSFIPALGSQRPVLLIYDGHSTHVGLNILELARKENITIIKLPGHTSHVLQPLDLAVMKSFKDRWDPLLVKWQRGNIGVTLPKSEFARLIGVVWREIDPVVIKNGFRKAGIVPFNSEIVQEDQFDLLKMKQWKLHNYNHLNKNPESLLSIVLKFINKVTSDLTINNVEVVTNKSDESKVSFEELLLNKVKRGETTKKTRQKIAPGAEVITHIDVILRKREENTKKKEPSASALKATKSIKDSQLETFTCKDGMPTQLRKKSKQTKTPKSTASSSGVIYLSSISRNDNECKAFTAKVPEDMPPCLQNTIPEGRKIKILSNILIKNPTEYNSFKKELTEAGPSGVNTKSKKGTKTYKNKENETPLTSNKQLETKTHQYSPGSSTTSVSGTVSIYSDSDSMDITFNDDDLTILERENEANANFEDALDGKTEKTEKGDEKCETISILKDKFIDSTQKDVIYFFNDHVLVRYYTKNKWIYYVGVIEDIIQNEESNYCIRFYKTIKKPNLVFKMPKKLDRDVVPEILIVKHIELKPIPSKANEYVLCNESDMVYF